MFINIFLLQLFNLSPKNCRKKMQMLASFPKKVSSYLFFMITGMYMYSHIFVFVLRKKPSPSPIPLIKCTFMSRFYVSQWVETFLKENCHSSKLVYFTKYFFDQTIVQLLSLLWQKVFTELFLHKFCFIFLEILTSKQMVQVSLFSF